MVPVLVAESVVYSGVFVDPAQCQAMQPLAHRAVPELAVHPGALRTRIHPRLPLSLHGNVILNQKPWLGCSLAILRLDSKPHHYHLHIQTLCHPRQLLLCMGELWSAVVLVGRGQLGLRQVDTLRRDPLHEGPDKGFPFFDMDLQRHQAPDSLAPKEIQSLITITSVVGIFA